MASINYALYALEAILCIFILYLVYGARKDSREFVSKDFLLSNLKFIVLKLESQASRGLCADKVRHMLLWVGEHGLDPQELDNMFGTNLKERLKHVKRFCCNQLPGSKVFSKGTDPDASDWSFVPLHTYFSPHSLIKGLHLRGVPFQVIKHVASVFEGPALQEGWVEAVYHALTGSSPKQESIALVERINEEKVQALLSDLEEFFDADTSIDVSTSEASPSFATTPGSETTGAPLVSTSPVPLNQLVKSRQEARSALKTRQSGKRPARTVSWNSTTVTAVEVSVNSEGSPNLRDEVYKTVERALKAGNEVDMSTRACVGSSKPSLTLRSFVKSASTTVQKRPVNLDALFKSEGFIHNPRRRKQRAADLR